MVIQVRAGIPDYTFVYVKYTFHSILVFFVVSFGLDDVKMKGEHAYSSSCCF